MAASERGGASDAEYGAGAAFYKVTGSGNDFVAFDRMAAGAGAALPSPELVRALCRRGLGVGADGAMVLRPAAGHDYELVYYNADGSRGELCGNASLCSVRLAVELGHARPGALRLRTDSGSVTARIADGLPEIDLPPPTEIQPRRDDLAPSDDAVGDRVGFARVGVPHVVVRCGDAGAVDVPVAARHFRHHPSLRDGANVNFVSRRGSRVALRTFERGVEAETLACGTGSVATAVLLAAWNATELHTTGDERHGSSGGPGARAAAGAAHPGGRPTPPRVAAPGIGVVADSETEIVTRSGLVHRVRIRAARADAPSHVSLAGAARIVYVGELREGDWEQAAR